MSKCTLCDKIFTSPSKLERHKNRKNPCNNIKEFFNCDLCNIDFKFKCDYERHNNSKKHITKITNIENQNITNNINIDNSINLNVTVVNGFSETNLGVIEKEDIERLLLYEDKIHKFIKDFTEYPDEIYGDSQYIIYIFKFFIKIFAKLNFNLAYSENHNCMIYSFVKSTSNFIEYHLLEIDNTQYNYNRKCIEYKLFIEEFLNLMKRVNNKFEVETFDYILNYIFRYKKMLFTSENAKIEIENELLTSYNKFEESKNSKESEEERFRVALLTARNNSFKHLIRKIK
jgi:uncharacterized C2H2 Zn-finger protein